MSEFNERTIPDQLNTHWLGRPGYYFAALDSTNSWLRARWEELPHGTLALADHQTAGKGRLGRHWVTPPNTAIAVSLLFEPSWPVEQANWFTMMAGVAAVRAIHTATNLHARLKWPNDIVFVNEDGTDLRKVGGILLEGDIQADRLQKAVLGIGLNVNLKTAALPPAAPAATSLQVELGRPVSRLALLDNLLINLEELYEAAVRWQSPQPVWEQLLINIGREVQVYKADGSLQLIGIALGTDRWGQLRIRDTQGQEHTIAAGDVSLRFPDSPPSATEN